MQNDLVTLRIVSQAESACYGAGVYCEMAAGCSMSALRTRHNLYKLLHQDGGGSRGKAKELLVGADPSRSCLIHRSTTTIEPSSIYYHTQKPHQITVVLIDTALTTL